MKNCVKCQKEIGVQDAYCQFCGSNQLRDELMDRLDKVEANINNTIKKENTGFLVTLSVLSIIGSVMGIGRGMMYEAVSDLAESASAGAGNGYIRGYIFVGSNIGSLIGVILMLSRKMNGLYVYTISQILYMLTVIWAVTCYDEVTFLAMSFATFFIVPSTVFLFLFWSKDIKNKLA